VIVMPYLGYGTARRLTVRGRVLEDERWRPASDTDSRWRNLARFWQHLESDEVPGARLRARFGNVAVEGLSDWEGYFRLELPVAVRPAWHAVAIDLLEPRGIGAVANVLVPSARARFGVISDIDDTIITSHVRSKVRMVLTAAFNNPRTRKPVTGVREFYRDLHAGGVNPFFYVSKSPWNLYPPLLEYLQLQGLPLGPLVLRDFGFKSGKNHKTEAIEDILRTYPALPFVLVGDNGERDAEIYADIARRFPGRVRAIYIRALRAEKARISMSSKPAASSAALK
jgi:phosphatidate phosphatase APP1